MNFELGKCIFIRLWEIFSFMPTFKEMLNTSNVFSNFRNAESVRSGRLEEATRSLPFIKVNEESVLSVKHHAFKEYT
jgi:hypothetical protein